MLNNYKSFLVYVLSWILHSSDWPLSTCTINFQHNIIHNRQQKKQVLETIFQALKKNAFYSSFIHSTRKQISRTHTAKRGEATTFKNKQKFPIVWLEVSQTFLVKNFLKHYNHKKHVPSQAQSLKWVIKNVLWIILCFIFTAWRHVACDTSHIQLQIISLTLTIV